LEKVQHKGWSPASRKKLYFFFSSFFFFFIFTQAEEILKGRESIRQAKWLIADGPRPNLWLDLLVLESEDHLVVVGAYGLSFESIDGRPDIVGHLGWDPNLIKSHLGCRTYTASSKPR